MYCPNCGAKLKDWTGEARFCDECGCRICDEGADQIISEDTDLLENVEPVEAEPQPTSPKRRTGLIIAIAAACVAVIAIAVILIVVLNSRKPSSGDSSEYVSAYKAFSEILSEKRNRLSNDMYLDRTTLPLVAFLDITGNEIPEMIYLEPADSQIHPMDLKILSWQNGKTEEIFAYEEWDAGAAAGVPGYYAFTREDDNSLYLCRMEGDESSRTVYYRLKESDDGMLYLEEVMSEEHPAPYEADRKDEYTVDGQESDENRYSEERTSLLQNASAVMLRKNNEYYYFSGYYDTETEWNWDDILFRDDSMTYDDAVHNLEAAAEYMQDEKNAPALDIAMMPALSRFLGTFNMWYQDEERTKEYDSSHAADGSSNIMEQIVKNGSCADYSVYPGNGTEYHWGEIDDPLGWAVSEFMSYEVFDGEETDWIANNIFNVSKSDIKKLAEQAERDHVFYRYDNSDGSYDYYLPIGGVGDGVTAVITSMEYDGERITVYYDALDAFETSDYWRIDPDSIQSYMANVELKEIEGRKYWSLYKHSKAEPVYDKIAAPDIFSETGGTYRCTSGVGYWSAELEVFPDGTFSGYSYDMNAGEGGIGYNGTQYVSDYHGKLTDPVKVAPFAYCAKVTDLTYDKTPGTEEIVNIGSLVRNVYVESPFSVGDEIYIYLKGIPLYRLPESVRSWAMFDNSYKYAETSWIQTANSIGYWRTGDDTGDDFAVSEELTEGASETVTEQVAETTTEQITETATEQITETTTETTVAETLPETKASSKAVQAYLDFLESIEYECRLIEDGQYEADVPLPVAFIDIDGDDFPEMLYYEFEADPGGTPLSPAYDYRAIARIIKYDFDSDELSNIEIEDSGSIGYMRFGVWKDGSAISSPEGSCLIRFKGDSDIYYVGRNFGHAAGIWGTINRLVYNEDTNSFSIDEFSAEYERGTTEPLYHGDPTGRMEEIGDALFNAEVNQSLSDVEIISGYFPGLTDNIDYYTDLGMKYDQAIEYLNKY